MASGTRKSSDSDPKPAQTAEGSVTYDESTNLGVDERKLVRKLDWHLVPLVMLLYTFSFLDRVNIGNARLYGLEEDLRLTGNQFQIAVSILFVTYIVFEIPSNLVLKPIGPQRWLAFIVLVWGVIALATGFVRNFGSLVALRVLLGAFEAGLFPGLNVYLTFFYTKRELALRVGYLFVSAAVAGALGGLLAYGIGHLDGVRGMSGWRWIMIIEGIPTIILGLLVLFFLPNDPEHARFLTPEEKKLMTARHRRQYGFTESAQKFSKKDMMKAFKDWKVWIFCIGQYGADTMLYDRKQMRGVFCAVFGAVSAIGYGLLISDTSAGVHYFATLYPSWLASGLGEYPFSGAEVVHATDPSTQLPNNSPRYGKRTTANGLQLTIGNASGIMASFIYPSTDAPRYIKGNAVSLSLVGLAALVHGLLWFWYSRENKRRDEGLIKPEHANLSEDELAELGDESPRFRYTI
ncbi:hypothetical protein CHU98_g1696 [Xylaria longipes]|nr:hypothetical protein CHU98_g1696 [Xylaria longipes]